ncbi:hypothetical protein Cgig2_027601 [Carnegiea gigantea]|uniref:Reverse transcriptase zinc-binding domain-containing protein n=1 Tax=Carnegiea gigantea TaxID=171969 RepID=A0A9Q1K708_9CARY|nr:hypothetical protein Cgig2_027601 [Carnegiea gigantea]
MRAKYFAKGDIFRATLGVRPSFTYIYGARDVIARGSCWLVGSGHSLSVWDDRWLPRPTSFKPVTPRTIPYENYKVSDLIDHANGCWREPLINHIFLPIDDEAILNIPLCSSWPADNLIWHYNSRGFVRHTTCLLTIFRTLGAHHHHITNTSGDLPGDVTSPAQIKLVGWRACVGSLPTAHNISSRVPDFSMTCSVYTHSEDTVTHAILECPLAVQIWGGSDLDTTLWFTRHRTLADCIAKAGENLDKDTFGDFLAVMWECWNARNLFIFRRPDNNLSVLGEGAIVFVRSFRELQNIELSPQTTLHPTYWSPPMTGYCKLNFDVGMVAGNIAGWGFVLRDHNGNVLLAGVSITMVILELQLRTLEPIFMAYIVHLHMESRTSSLKVTA